MDFLKSLWIGSIILLVLFFLAIQGEHFMVGYKSYDACKRREASLLMHYLRVDIVHRLGCYLGGPFNRKRCCDYVPRTQQ